MNKNFSEDLAFLNSKGRFEVLKMGNAAIIVAPQWQGRVMTSTYDYLSGPSYGWINYELISSGVIKPQINVFGGEDRFWLGPEGGQYSIFFKNGSEFDFSKWATPEIIDTIPFDIKEKTESFIKCSKDCTLINFSNTTFEITLERSVEVLANDAIMRLIGIEAIDDLKTVAYCSENVILNKGKEAWSKEKGLLSVWILGMMIPSDDTTIILPYKEKDNAANLIRDNYFGVIPDDRLVRNSGLLLFKADGKHRGKIGLPSSIATPFAGSYDSKKNVLTIVHYDFSDNADYVNSLWEIQENPYSGDVVNAYNDGPMADGSQLGPFYELESSSPAKELKPGECIRHKHYTMHFEGDFNTLNKISKKILGCDLDIFFKQ